MQASVAIHHHRRAWEDISDRFLRLFLLVDALSLVAPAVAVVWQLALSRGFRVPLSPSEPLALALAIWSLYAADHVLDARRKRSSPWELGRKAFHRLHWPTMAALACCSAIGSFGIAVLSLPPATLAGGIAVSVFVLVYFASVHSLPFRWRGFWPREAVVALGFGLGTFVPLWTEGGTLLLVLMPVCAVFFLLCWLNCCAVESWEWLRCGSPPEQMPHASTRWIGRHMSPLAICVATGSLLIARWWGIGYALGLAGFSSGAALCLLARVQEFLSDSVVGVSADLALCAPLLLLAVHRIP
ncbi:MAG: hypothetical protein ACJ746_31655 [Bryobacteraceae bacterium]